MSLKKNLMLLVTLSILGCVKKVDSFELVKNKGGGYQESLSSDGQADSKNRMSWIAKVGVAGGALLMLPSVCVANSLELSSITGNGTAINSVNASFPILSNPAVFYLSPRLVGTSDGNLCMPFTTTDASFGSHDYEVECFASSNSTILSVSRSQLMQQTGFASQFGANAMINLPDLSSDLYFVNARNRPSSGDRNAYIGLYVKLPSSLSVEVPMSLIDSEMGFPEYTYLGGSQVLGVGRNSNDRNQMTFIWIDVQGNILSGFSTNISSAINKTLGAGEESDGILIDRIPGTTNAAVVFTIKNGVNKDVYGMVIDSTTKDIDTALANQQLLNFHNIGKQSISSIAFKPGTNIVVVAHNSDGQDGDGFGVYANLFEVDGSAWNRIGFEQRISSDTIGNQLNGQISWMDNDYFSIVYSGSVSAAGSPTKYQLFLTVNRLDSSTQWSSSVIQDTVDTSNSNTGGSIADQQISYDSENNTINLVYTISTLSNTKSEIWRAIIQVTYPPEGGITTTVVSTEAVPTTAAPVTSAQLAPTTVVAVDEVTTVVENAEETTYCPAQTTDVATVTSIQTSTPAITPTSTATSTATSTPTITLTSAQPLLTTPPLVPDAQTTDIAAADQTTDIAKDATTVVIAGGEETTAVTSATNTPASTVTSTPTNTQGVIVGGGQTSSGGSSIGPIVGGIGAAVLIGGVVGVVAYKKRQNRNKADINGRANSITSNEDALLRQASILGTSTSHIENAPLSASVSAAFVALGAGSRNSTSSNMINMSQLASSKTPHSNDYTNPGVSYVSPFSVDSGSTGFPNKDSESDEKLSTTTDTDYYPVEDVYQEMADYYQEPAFDNISVAIANGAVHEYGNIHQQEGTDVVTVFGSEVKMLGDKPFSGGNFSEVWLSEIKRDKFKGKRFATKVLKDNSQAGMKEFVTEMNNLLGVSHTNICSIEAMSIDPKTFAYTLFYPFAEGGSLDSYVAKREQAFIDNGAIRVEGLEALAVARQLASALDYLSSKIKMLHRDVALRNILVSRVDTNGSIKSIQLADFGLARVADPQQNQEFVYVNKGSQVMMKGPKGLVPVPGVKGDKLPIRWLMCPSVCAGNAFTSDVYPYSATMWELMSGGQKPLIAETTAARKNGASASAAIRAFYAAGRRMSIGADWPDRFGKLVKIMRAGFDNDPADRWSFQDIIKACQVGIEEMSAKATDA